MKYIKFIGANGAGKTTHLLRLVQELSGVPIFSWMEKKEQVKYREHGDLCAIGSYKETRKCNGSDPMVIQKGYDFLGRMERQDFSRFRIVLEEGLTTQSFKIITKLQERFDVYVIYLNFDMFTLRDNVERLRGGSIKEKNLKNKYVGCKNIFSKLSCSKLEITSKVVEDNIKRILEFVGETRCKNQKQVTLSNFMDL